MPRHFLTLSDFSREEIENLFQRTALLKRLTKEKKFEEPLKHKTLGLIFEKTSTRTRVSFEVAMSQLGGNSVTLTTQTSQIGRGESHEDTARVLSRYVHGIVIRTFEQEKLVHFAKHATVPVINGLTDFLHPCQLLADLFTILENKGSLQGIKIAWLGDGNNLANSWIEAATILGFELTLACPEGFDPSPFFLQKIASGQYPQLRLTRDPAEAVRKASVINTDTWVSMGQEGTGEADKKRILRPYQLNGALLKEAKPDCMVLHCLPAHRGEEITDEVMDGPQSRIWDQAENRMHVQKALLEKLMS